jgi:hypothetical protein
MNVPMPILFALIGCQRRQLRASLIWRKNIEILENFNPIGKIPMNAFESKD